MKNRQIVVIFIIWGFSLACTNSGSTNRPVSDLLIVQTDLKYGLMDKKGSVVQAMVFDRIEVCSNGLFRVEDSSRYGWLSRDGKVLQAPIYDVFQKKGSAIYRSPLVEELIQRGLAPYESDLGDFFEGLAIIQSGGKWGYSNEKGEVIIPPIYSRVGPFFNGMAAATSDQLAGVIDKKGDWVVEPAYEAIGSFIEGFAAIKSQGKWGFMDEKGKVVVNPAYEKVHSFWGGKALCVQGGMSFIIDRKGDIQKTLPFRASFLTSDLLLIEDSSKGFGLGTLDGNVILPPGYDWISRPFKGKMLVKEAKTNMIGMVDEKGMFIVPCTWKDVRVNGMVAGVLPALREVDWFEHGVMTIVVGQKEGEEQFGAIDPQGKYVVPPIYEYIGPFSGQLAPVKVGDVYGFLDKTGSIKIQPRYQAVRPFDEGLAAVKENEKWGVIDEDGNMVADVQWDYVGDFNNGFAYVIDQGRNINGYINRKGDLGARSAPFRALAGVRNTEGAIASSDMYLNEYYPLGVVLGNNLGIEVGYSQKRPIMDFLYDGEVIHMLSQDKHRIKIMTMEGITTFIDFNQVRVPSASEKVPSDLDQEILKIRAEYARINSMSLQRGEPFSWHRDECGSGRVRFEVEEGEVVRIIENGNLGKNLEWEVEYYFKNEQLFFIFEKSVDGYLAGDGWNLYPRETRIYVHQNKIFSQQETSRRIDATPVDYRYSLKSKPYQLLQLYSGGGNLADIICKWVETRPQNSNFYPYY